MTAPPCGRDDCPVPDPAAARHRLVRTTVWEKGARLYRGVPVGARSPSALVRGGDSRFAPLPGVAHAYVARSRTAALLESALHEASGPDPTIYLARLVRREIAPVELTEDIRLVDLRDPSLLRLRVARAALVNTTPAHYPCTRLWAQELCLRRPGGHRVGGAVWESRQADLHVAANPGGLVADVLRHEPVEVAVLWHPSGPEKPLRSVGPREPLVVDGRATRLVEELSSLIGAPVL